MTHKKNWIVRRVDALTMEQVMLFVISVIALVIATAFLVNVAMAQQLPGRSTYEQLRAGHNDLDTVASSDPTQIPPERAWNLAVYDLWRCYIHINPQWDDPDWIYHGNLVNVPNWPKCQEVGSFIIETDFPRGPWGIAEEHLLQGPSMSIPALKAAVEEDSTAAQQTEAGADTLGASAAGGNTTEEAASFPWWFVVSVLLLALLWMLGRNRWLKKEFEEDMDALDENYLEQIKETREHHEGIVNQLHEELTREYRRPLRVRNSDAIWQEGPALATPPESEIEAAGAFARQLGEKWRITEVQRGYFPAGSEADVEFAFNRFDGVVRAPRHLIFEEDTPVWRATAINEEGDRRTVFAMWACFNTAQGGEELDGIFIPGDLPTEDEATQTGESAVEHVGTLPSTSPNGHIEGMGIPLDPGVTTVHLQITVGKKPEVPLEKN